jgi:hypothetical protein
MAYVPQRIECLIWRTWRQDTPISAVEEALNSAAARSAQEASFPLWIPQNTSVVWLATEIPSDLLYADLTYYLRLEVQGCLGSVFVNSERVYTEEELCFSRLALPLSPRNEKTSQPYRIAVRITSRDHACCLFEAPWVEGTPEGYVMPRVHVADSDVGRIVVRVKNPANRRMTVSLPDFDLVKESHAPEVTVEYPNLPRWTPEEPQRTIVVVGMPDNSSPAAASTSPTPWSTVLQTGLRWFTVKDRRFQLNGRPYPVRAATLDTSVIPHMDTDEACVRCIRACKNLGFTLLRLRFLPPRIFTAAAEREGMPLWIELDAERPASCTSVMLREINNPAVVIWGLCTDGSADSAVRDAIAYIRKIDETRVILAYRADGREGAPSYVVRSFRHEPEPMAWLRLTANRPLPPSVLEFLRRLPPTHGLAFAEIEQTLLPPENPPTAWREAFTQEDLSTVFKSPETMAHAHVEAQWDALSDLLIALRTNTALAGFSLRQKVLRDRDTSAPRIASDAPWEIAEWAGVYAPMVERLADVAPLPYLSKVVCFPEEPFHAEVLLANEGSNRLEGVADVTLSIFAPTSQVLWKKRRQLKLVKHGKSLWSGDLTTSRMIGRHRFQVRIHTPTKSAYGETSFWTVPMRTTTRLPVHLVDPQKTWAKRLEPYFEWAPPSAKVHLIPPLGKSVLGYPEADLVDALEQAHAGGVTILAGPPKDWNVLQNYVENLPLLEWEPGHGAFTGDELSVYYFRAHPWFEDIEPHGIMGTSFAPLLPSDLLRTRSSEPICGVLRWDSAHNAVRCHDLVVVRPYGEGRLVFCTLRLFENWDSTPLATLILSNAVRYSLQKALTPHGSLPFHQTAVNMLAQEKGQRIRRWEVCGPFVSEVTLPKALPHPLETGYDPEAEYETAYGKVSWQTTYTCAPDHECVVQEACAPAWSRLTYALPCTAYAYAEIRAVEPCTLFPQLETAAAVEVRWNGICVYQSQTQGVHGFPLHVRQGRNTLLIQLVQPQGGPCRFRFYLSAVEAAQARGDIERENIAAQEATTPRRSGARAGKKTKASAPNVTWWR